MYHEINEESIEKLMDIFYAKVRADKSGLGEIFNKAVGRKDEAWEKHKAKIALFWKGVLLNLPGYNGQPLKAHLDLPPFPRELFDVWLTLFAQSLEQIYTKEAAEPYFKQAQMIAQRFQIMLYEYKHSS